MHRTVCNLTGTLSYMRVPEERQSFLITAKEHLMEHPLDTCCNVQLAWQLLSPEWADHKIEGARCSQCGTTFEQKEGSSKVYILRGNEYRCSGCNAVIQSARVAHPIHDGPAPFSGSGRCRYEDVPYCPQCETPPSSAGSIITASAALV